MYCNKCGNELKDTDESCAKCGEKTSESDENKNKTSKFYYVFKSAMIVGILLFLYGIIAFGLITMDKNTLKKVDNTTWKEIQKDISTNDINIQTVRFPHLQVININDDFNHDNGAIKNEVLEYNNVEDFAKWISNQYKTKIYVYHTLFGGLALIIIGIVGKKRYEE